MADETVSNLEPSAANRYTYYEYLHFIPVEYKTPYWASQVLLFNKFNCRRLVDLKEAKKFRDQDAGLMDKQAIIDIIDPPQADKSGGRADYFTADFKSNPITMHMKRIHKAKLDQLPLSHVVSAADEYFQSNKQKENSRILGRRQFLSFINEMNRELGFPPLREDDDPFKYAAQVMRQVQSGQTNSIESAGIPTMMAPQDVPTTMLDNIKASIEDNEDLALFNEYIYKDGVEIALELGIEYYLTENKFQITREDIFNDLLNFNAACLRSYTSLTSGRPKIEYLDPAKVFTSQFGRRDGQGMTAWYVEDDFTFGDFVRMFGANLSKEELKRIFNKNRETQGSILTQNIPEYDRCSPLQRDAAKIRIGYMEWESQDMEVYGGGALKGNMRYSRMSSDWQVTPKNPLSEPFREELYYNVWYKCYYIPLYFTQSNNSTATSDFDMMSKYIYDFGKVQDQVREGDDLEFSKPSLVVWRDTSPSYAEIEDRFKSKIDLIWQQFQNDIANAMPHGLWFNDEIITAALEALDEAGNDGKDNTMEVLKQLKQTGYGFGKMFTENSRPVPPFTEIRTGHYASAMEKLSMMMQLYSLSQQALGGNSVASGQTPDPRTPMGGIDYAMEATDNATYYLRKGYIDMYAELGKRLVYYFREVCAYPNSRRFKEFASIVAKANSMALEAINDIPLRTLGLSVDMANTEQANAFMNQFILELGSATNGYLEPDEALELTFIKNVKYKFAITRMKMKKKRRERMKEAEIQHQRQMELVQAQGQNSQQQALMLQQMKMELIDRQKQWDERIMQLENVIKMNGQLQVKDKIVDGRIQEAAFNAELQTNQEQQRSLV